MITWLRPWFKLNRSSLNCLVQRQSLRFLSAKNYTMAASAKHDQMVDSEKNVKRNPHPDFGKVEESREDWSEDRSWHFTRTRKPGWKPGDSANDGGESLSKNHVEINPYEEGRPAVFNYKLLISAIVPRPIGFISTVSMDGNSTNLAPFSYFQLINHDPPLFIVGFTGGFDKAKDSLRNLKDTGECCVNIISEHFIEAANSTSINAPHGMSEWAFSGLHPAPCTIVRASRVKESVFSIEAKLQETKEYESKVTPGKKTGVLAIIEGCRFWVREDAINEERNLVAPEILRPMCRLGGITYGRLTEGIELLRPDWQETMKSKDTQKFAKPKTDGQ